MAAPMIIALIASALLADQKAREDQRNYKAQQKVEAAKERFAAFTGQRGQTLGRPSASNTMMQGLMSGALMGQQLSGGDTAGAAGSLLGNVPQSGATPAMSNGASNAPGNPGARPGGLYDPYKLPA